MSDLNPMQRRAVEVTEGPLLVLAGAGTGKTTVLTRRLAHILETGKALPFQILAVTFTNKAAREMSRRIEALVGQKADGLWLGTFHKMAARILRRHPEPLGLTSQFSIFDRDDQEHLMKRLLSEKGLDPKTWSPRSLLATIQRWKDKSMRPDGVVCKNAREREIKPFYTLYQEALIALNAVDFGDLILHTLTLFSKEPSVLQKYQEQFSYVLVDEYQDTNVAQYLWLRLLSQRTHNLCCVGDDDQSIYGWRGAELNNILDFEKTFPGAVVVRLERNYRSTSHILKAASALVANNQGRLGKELWTHVKTGDPVRIRSFPDSDEEARSISQHILRSRAENMLFGDMVVLVRAGFQTRVFEESFVKHGIPYTVVGSTRFYEREEIRDVLAYLRLIRQPSHDIALERIMNKPTRGLGAATLNLIRACAREESLSMWEAIGSVLKKGTLPKKSHRALASFMDSLERWRALSSSVDHNTCAETVMKESGYWESWEESSHPKAATRLENLREFLSALHSFESLDHLLEHTSLTMETSLQEAPSDVVTLMTLHAAKGLEFSMVFLPGWEEGLFPHPRSLASGKSQQLEEERRLAYVGLTRAKQCAFVSFSYRRQIHGKWQSASVSRFVDELPHQYVSKEIAPPHQPRDTKRWSPQDICHHKFFGQGVVTAVDEGRLIVEFEEVGVRRVMMSFVW